MSLTVALYTLMYMLMFISYLVLQFKYVDLHRDFVAAKSRWLRITYGILGFILSAFGFVVTFFPPADLSVSSKHTYLMLLVSAFVVMLVLPFILYRFHDKWALQLGVNVDEVAASTGHEALEKETK